MKKHGTLSGEGCLTDKQVRHMEPESRRKEVPAGPPAGLYLVLHTSGRRSWMVRYRYAGRTRGLTLKDAYPELTLAQARAEAQAALDKLDEGIDPAVLQSEEIERETPNTVKSVAEEWLKRAVKQTATHDEVSRIIHKEILSEWKHKTIRDITRPDVLRLLDAIVDKPAPVLANRTLSILKRFFRWCLERGYIDVSPVAGIRPPVKEQTRDRVLTEPELREIWNAAPDLGYPFGHFVRFLLLTGQRRGEVANVQWGHIDIETALWTLPRASTKARRIHDVGLSRPVLQMLTEKDKKGHFTFPRFKGPFVFSTTSGEVAISGFSKMKAALDNKIIERRRKAAGKAGLDTSKIEGLAQWGLHDLRRTFATWCADHDVAPHVLAALLNHSPGSTLGITAIYARSKWSKEKLEALEKWGAYVATLTEEKAAAKAAS